MRSVLLALALAFPASAFAAGGEDFSPPRPTQTTTECAEGLVYDDTTKACVAPKESNLSDDALYQAVRELAWAGRFETARAAIAAMSDASEDRVLTYLGFIHRKEGDMDGAMAYYSAALSRNPDNLLARSYIGQGFVEMGQIDRALAQLREIRARGGRMTWADVALDQAIRTGRGTSY
ncbi:MAG: tetratricopeptide repeat protein [Pseudomonadota bacterium]